MSAEEESLTEMINAENIRYVNYESEVQMPDIIGLCQKYLSEPYSVYTYRYFIHNWGKLCFLAYDNNQCVGVIVCKLDVRDSRDATKAQAPREISTIQTTDPPNLVYKGYIAMLVVKKEYRKLKIGSKLVKLAVNAMKESQADEVVLETEVTNKPAQRLYENLGFLRDRRFFRYYLNGLDALRLKLWIDPNNTISDGHEAITDGLASMKVDITQSSNHSNNATTDSRATTATRTSNHDNSTIVQQSCVG